MKLFLIALSIFFISSISFAAEAKNTDKVRKKPVLAILLPEIDGAIKNGKTINKSDLKILQEEFDSAFQKWRKFTIVFDEDRAKVMMPNHDQDKLVKPNFLLLSKILDFKYISKDELSIKIEMKIKDATNGKIKNKHHNHLNRKTGKVEVISGIKTIKTTIKVNEDYRVIHINKLGHKIASIYLKFLTETVFPMRILNVKDNRIWINQGKVILRKGLELEVFRREEKKNSKNITVEKKETFVGKVKVVKANPKFTVTTMTPGFLDTKFEKGYIVRFMEKDLSQVTSDLFVENSDTVLEIGKTHYKNKEYSKALEYFKASAQLGNGEAMNRVGLMYYDGKGVYKNERKAIDWITKSAEKGYVWGQYNLAKEYYSGNFLSLDYKEAFKWHKKAGEQGNPDAQNYLGLMYYSGNGIQKNYNEALKWFEKSAKQEYRAAQYNLGHQYKDGNGVSQNFDKAFYWFSKSAELGYSSAQNELGLMYSAGTGVSKNFAKAVDWFRKSAEQGNDVAQNNLGYMYANGKGVKQDNKEATKWYQKAANQGNTDAKNSLAKLEKKSSQASVQKKSKLYENYYSCKFEFHNDYMKRTWNITMITLSLKGVSEPKEELYNNICSKFSSKTIQILPTGNDNSDLIKKNNSGHYHVKLRFGSCLFDYYYGISGDRFVTENNYDTKCSVRSSSNNSSGKKGVSQITPADYNRNSSIVTKDFTASCNDGNYGTVSRNTKTGMICASGNGKSSKCSHNMSVSSAASYICQ